MGANEQAPDPRKRTAFGKAFNVLRQTLTPITDEELYQTSGFGDQPIARRDTLINLADTATNKTASYLETSWKLMQDIVNGLADKAFHRKKFVMGGMIALFAIGLAIDKVFQEDPNLIEDARLRAELNSVWSEVEELKNPPTHQKLLEQVHNAFKPIQLTGDELDNAIIVDDEDSEGVVDGIRRNSFGPEQPGAWSLVAAQKLTDGLRLLGRDGTVVAYDFAQPGASSRGLDYFEDPEGNVQLGARTAQDMAADHPGEPTPTEVMIDHDGFLFASCGLHGDDMRDTADTLLKYIDDKSPHYSAALLDFINEPKKEKLYTGNLTDILVEILTSYKNDKERIKTNFQKALDDYEAINASRQKEGKGRMVLLVSQPPALDTYKTIPYVPLGSEKGETGELNITQYGAAGHLAAFWTMAPFYFIEGPILKDFEQRTGIQVTSTPLLALQIPKAHLAQDSHLNKYGHVDRANAVVQVVNVTDGDSQLAFEANGVPKVA